MELTCRITAVPSSICIPILGAGTRLQQVNEPPVSKKFRQFTQPGEVKVVLFHQNGHGRIHYFTEIVKSHEFTSKEEVLT